MSETNLKENPFRDEIFDYFIHHGYRVSKKEDYDFKHALDTAKLFEFLEESQSEQLTKFKKAYGADYQSKYVDLLCKKIDDRGLITALNEPVEDYTSGTKFYLAYFKTQLEVMSGGLEKYEKNIFSVRKEFSYEDKEDSFSVDLAIFINGIPVVMIELKKQTAGQKAGFEGTKQFKTTRDPKQLCFAFNKRTLIYFAVDELVAFMTTRLDKQDTKFLPFNQGDGDEAGNPVVPGKHSTYYLWEKILQKDMLLRIIREFMFIDDEGTMIFPRYHQLRAVLRVEQDVKGNGVGGRYLIWHSAGSGKTKTIAWLSKRLINNPDINSVIIISDRTVIDRQLSAELMNVDHKGVAQHIETTSKELLEYLNKGGYIIVTTLQKFHPILQGIRQHPGRHYAIIIDEAHSSTAGQSMSKASETLTGVSLKDAVEMEDAYDDQEDGQNQLLKNKELIEATNNVSYFAFTATPKNKTIELFGTRTEKGKTYFDKYSMKQAVDEHFIVYPLQCYTNYYAHYELQQTKDDGRSYDAGRSQQAIMNYVSSDDDVIQDKVSKMMNDFLTNRIHWLNGKAKAMVITPSRKHAVLYKLAIDKYLQQHGSKVGTCAAFTGKIEHEGIQLSEKDLNKKYVENGVKYDIKSIIANHDDLRIIVVADKLQTGFDEKKLCVMYIDKKLGSAVKAVQTISRINRPAKNKQVFVMDFVNKRDDIKAYFTEFYGGEIFMPAENETDPNILFTKRDEIIDYCVVTKAQVEAIYQNIKTKGSKAGELTSLVAQIQKDFRHLDDEKKQLFTGKLHKFTQLFYYIATLLNRWDDELKMYAVVFDCLYKVLHEKADVDIINPEEFVRLTDFSVKVAQENEAILVESEDNAVEKISTEVSVKEENNAFIREIVEAFNTKYADGQQELQTMVDELAADDGLVANVRDSSKSASADAVRERIRGRVTEEIVNSALAGNVEKEKFYTEFGNSNGAIDKMSAGVIRAIEEFLRGRV